MSTPKPIVIPLAIVIVMITFLAGLGIRDVLTRVKEVEAGNAEAQEHIAADREITKQVQGDIAELKTDVKDLAGKVSTMSDNQIRMEAGLNTLIKAVDKLPKGP